MASIKVNINPNILKWAREEAGFDVNEIAERAEITVDRYSGWEENGQDIPLGKLKILSTQFKRQVAFFFLPEIPPRPPKPRDYRNLAPNKSKLSKKVLLAIRDANYFLETSLQLKGIEYWNEVYTWSNEISTSNYDENQLIEWLRNKLEITLATQTSWKNVNEAWREWREAVESKLGIFVYQFSMPPEEVQGFGVADTIPYGIVTNSKYSPQNRIFTLFHELAHIFRKHSSLCLIDRYRRNQQAEEYSCNNFAGKFLIPDDSVNEISSMKDLKSKASKLNVSREAYLRRAFEEHTVSRNDFFNYLSEIKESNADFVQPSGFVLPQVKSHTSRGRRFFDLVIEGLRNNVISYSKASDLLDLRINRVLNES